MMGPGITMICNGFSFYTDDKRALSLIKESVTSASMGKGCARIKYNDECAIEVLMDASKEIVDYHTSKQSLGIRFKGSKEMGKATF